MMWLVAVVGLAGPLAAWASWASLSHLYGQDAALYTMIAARHAAGEPDALRLGGLAPGVPFGLSLLLRAGLSPTRAFRAFACAGHLALLTAVFVFALAIARETGLGRRGTGMCAAATVLLFGLAPNVLGYGLEPLTDQPSLALLLLALALLPHAPRLPHASLLLGCLAAASYLFRYVSLSQAALVLVGHLVQLRRSERRAAQALACLAPVVLCVVTVTAWLSGPEFGLSYGANTQLALNVALQQRREAVGDHVYHLAPGDTLTFAAIDPADPRAWNTYYWMSRREFTKDGRMLPRLLAVLASPLTTFARAASELQQLLAEFGPLTPGVGGICWLLLLSRTRGSTMMWTATALAMSTILGGTLAYFMEVRYVWLLGIMCLAALPAALGLGWRAFSLPRRLDDASAGPWPLATAGRIAGVALVGGALVMAAVRIVVDLGDATHRLREEQVGQRGVERLLAPAAERAARTVAQGGLPFSAPTVMSARAGQLLSTGCRWLPLPAIPISSRTWADAGPEQKEAWVRRMLAVMRRGNVKYVVLRDDEYRLPSLRPLFPRTGKLPPELERVGASSGGEVRVLRLRPQRPDPGISRGPGESGVSGRLASADQL
jgi:hypothetical protein